MLPKPILNARRTEAEISGEERCQADARSAVRRPALTNRQVQVLRCVEHFVAVHGCPSAAVSQVDSTTPALSAKQIDEHRLRRLTARQQAVLDFIREHIRIHRSPPTLREIGKAMGIRSSNGTNDHLRALERKGFIRRRAGLSRSIVIVGDPEVPPLAPAVALAESWAEENKALRTLLSRVEAASRRMPALTAEMVVLLGDVRTALRGGGA